MFKERAVSTCEGLITFRMPRVILTTGAIKTLSANALRLYMSVGYSAFKTRATEVEATIGTIFRDTGLDMVEAEEAAQELTDANVMDYQVQGRRFRFQCLQPDHTKAKSYMSLDGKVNKNSKQI